ncbi:hypothetical protein [Nostoc sp.]
MNHNLLLGSTDICATQPFTASLQVRVSDRFHRGRRANYPLSKN